MRGDASSDRFAALVARKKKIAILGAGPAGSSMAIQLVDRGVDPGDLLILDKARFPRPKLCGGGVTFRGTEILGRLLGADTASLGLTTRELEFVSSAGRPFPVRERGPQWVFDRSVLDARLLAAAKSRGVEVREECTVTELSPGTEGWRVRMGDVTETYDWVLGCDGATGLSRRASGLRGGLTGRLVEAVFERTSSAARTDTLYFDFDPILDGIPGYAWIFPYADPEAPGAERFKLGVMDGRGRASGEALRKWTQGYAERQGFRCLEAKVAGFPERYFHPSAESHRPGLALVGEAFGIDPLLGEGIAPALFHAEHVAEHLMRALHRGDAHLPGIDAAFRRSDEGWNLWLQWHLAERLYGRHPLRWLHILFDMAHLRELAGKGEDAYGRLSRRVPSLLAHFSWQVLRRGLPAIDPALVRTRAHAISQDATNQGAMKPPNESPTSLEAET